MAYCFEVSYSKLGFGESYGLSVDMSSVSTHKKVMSKKTVKNRHDLFRSWLTLLREMAIYCFTT
ncbi:hypothetical protein CWC12_19295 [Pseudoalteromonas ruthenica]|nr:hypothetical protein CWC12_19295 [Pseudoalteromonas ruthenica]TMP22396.1 hypothetical protein CWC06_15620 [Pseudoalteromonas ruthenica]